MRAAHGHGVRQLRLQLVHIDLHALRAAADDAETICGEDYWPLPSYSKMLYYV